MDWSLAIKEEREVLKRMVALFYALAALADLLSRRSSRVRSLVLWILRPAVAIALDYIADAGPVQEAFLRESGDSMAEAKRYSRCFRAAARSLKGLLKALDRCEAYEDVSPICANRYLPDFGASLRRLSGCDPLRSGFAASTRLRGFATGPPMPQRRDSS